MAISVLKIRGVQTATGSAGTTSVSVRVSKLSASKDDLVLCFVYGSGATPSGLPSGFTQVAVNGPVKVGQLRFNPASAPTNYTTTTGSNQGGVFMHIIAIYGVGGTALIAASSAIEAHSQLIDTQR